MIEKATVVLPYHSRLNPPGGECSCGHVTPLGRMTSEHVARAVVDAILPQVSTEAEIEALPVGSIVTDGDGAVYRRDADRWWDRPGSAACLNSAALYDPNSPWIVVWQPEVTA